MPARTLLIAAVAALVLLSAAPAQAARDKNWATVNVCRSPTSVGLRASMPGLADHSSVMFMRFRVQYRTRTKAWKVVPGLDTRFLRIGSGRSGRVAGRSFKIGAPKKGASFTLRGLVNFQWRAGSGKLLKATGRITTGGHRGTVGSDPKGYSAATCVIRG